MASFVEVTAEEVEQLVPALRLFERIAHESYNEFPDYALYGFTTDPALVENAQEIVNEFYEGDEDQDHLAVVKLRAIAIAITVSADELYYLTGTGLKADVQTFAYSGGGAEGARTMSFNGGIHQRTPVRMTLSSFSKLALGDGDSYLDEFYTENAKSIPQQAENVSRTDDATATPEPHPGETPETVEKQPPLEAAAAPGKMSSLNIAEILEDFLG